MRYARIDKASIENGPGIRVSLFVQGCTLRCKGCFNHGTWDFNGGIEYTKETEAEILEAINKPYISGLSILGGEPYDQLDSYLLVELVHKIRLQCPEKDIWVWTGYEFDYIKNFILTKEIDVAVTGPFKIDQKDITSNNVYRGSRNQKVIDVKSSLKINKAVAVSGIPNNEV